MSQVSLTALYQDEIRKFDEYDLEDFKDPGKYNISKLTIKELI